MGGRRLRTRSAAALIRISARPPCVAGAGGMCGAGGVGETGANPVGAGNAQPTASAQSSSRARGARRTALVCCQPRHHQCGGSPARGCGCRAPRAAACRRPTTPVPHHTPPPLPLGSLPAGSRCTPAHPALPWAAVLAAGLRRWTCRSPKGLARWRIIHFSSLVVWWCQQETDFPHPPSPIIPLPPTPFAQDELQDPLLRAFGRLKQLLANVQGMC